MSTSTIAESTRKAVRFVFEMVNRRQGEMIAKKRQENVAKEINKVAHSHPVCVDDLVPMHGASDSLLKAVQQFVFTGEMKTVHDSTLVADYQSDPAVMQYLDEIRAQFDEAKSYNEIATIELIDLPEHKLVFDMYNRTIEINGMPVTVKSDDKERRALLYVNLIHLLWQYISVHENTQPNRPNEKYNPIGRIDYID